MTTRSTGPAGLDHLMATYGRGHVMPYEEQVHCGRLVRAWLDHEPPCPLAVVRRGQRARDRLVRGNLRLVLSIAQRWRHSVAGDGMQDLIQAGALGLMRAAEKFDPTRGYKFSTYSFWWIRQAMGRHLDQDCDVVHLPANRLSDFRRLSRLVSDYRAEHTASPSLAWLSDQTGFGADYISETIVIGQLRTVAALDQHVHLADNESLSLSDSLASDIDLLAELEAVDLHERQRDFLDEAINSLPPLEREAMNQQRAGATQTESAATIGLSRASIGNRRAAAKRHIIQHAAAQGLGVAELLAG